MREFQQFIDIKIGYIFQPCSGSHQSNCPNKTERTTKYFEYVSVYKQSVEWNV